jgi:integrase
MPKSRSHGDGSLWWDEPRQRWTAEITIGYTPAGKRRRRTATAKTKTAAKAKLKELIRDLDDGVSTAAGSHTVAQAVHDWLRYGLAGRSQNTIEKSRILAEQHVISALGARQLRELSADDLDEWLADKAKTLSTRTLREVRSILSRSIKRAQARDKVRRNVVLLCEMPTGQPGRPSKSLTLDQVKAVLAAAEGAALYAYVVLSLLIGARTEELRALTWSHVDLVGEPDADPPVPPSIQVWRSVRAGGDTKTKKSRRTLRLPRRCVEALRTQQEWQAAARRAAGKKWHASDLVFTSRVGTPLDASHVRRSYRAIVKKAGLVAGEWTPREMRHSFVSILSDADVPIEKISQLVGHSDTTVTETVYRHQLRPMLTQGAEAMDEIFAD